MLGDCECVVFWVPGPHDDPLRKVVRRVHRSLAFCCRRLAQVVHYDVGTLLGGALGARILVDHLRRLCHGCWYRAEESLVFIETRKTTLLASFVLKLNSNRRVDSPLQIDDVRMRVVGPREHHAGIWRHLEVEFVKNALTFVHLAKGHVEVLGDVQGLDGLRVIAHVPNVDGEVVAREEVVVTGRCEPRHADRVDNVGEEVLARRILLQLYLHAEVVELGGRAQVTQTDVAIAGGEEEHVGALRVILHVRDHLCELFDVGGL